MDHEMMPVPASSYSLAELIRSISEAGSVRCVVCIRLKLLKYQQCATTADRAFVQKIVSVEG